MYRQYSNVLQSQTFMLSMGTEVGLEMVVFKIVYYYISIVLSNILL